MKVANDALSKLIKHLNTYGFLKCIEEGDLVKNFTFGPAGELLRETLKNEWIYSNVVHQDYNVFTFSSSPGSDLLPGLQDAFYTAKNLTNSLVPFGLAETGRLIVSDSANPGTLVPRIYTALKYYAFIGSGEAEQFFYRFQQERKRWWRKFSLDPGKFSIAELEKEEGDAIQTARIVAQFPWGVHALESIQLLGSAPFKDISFEDENIFSVRYKKRKCLPHLVTSCINADYAAFSYMCDAFSVKRGKVILKFHRKLAPFKFAFAASPGTDDENKELLDLAELICLGLKKSGLSSLLPVKGEFTKKKLDIQLLKSDSLGVPYTIVLDKETLNTGIFGLYSRDTTLQEQVHISKMPQYGELLMKNY